jgi:hypothetical protein
MILATWEASDTLAVIGLCTTALVGIAGIVTGHIRETRLHNRQIESDRAHAIRERALDAAYRASEIADDMTALAEAPAPSSFDEVTIALRRSQPVFGKQVMAHQEAQRLATLGWSVAVRTAAKRLANELLSAGVNIHFPELVMRSRAPEAPTVASGDEGFWTRYQDGMRAGAEALRGASTAFLEAIEP